jgi:hypothetical protein
MFHAKYIQQRQVILTTVQHFVVFIYTKFKKICHFTKEFYGQMSAVFPTTVYSIDTIIDVGLKNIRMRW